MTLVDREAIRAWLRRTRPLFSLRRATLITQLITMADASMTQISIPSTFAHLPTNDFEGTPLDPELIIAQASLQNQHAAPIQSNIVFGKYSIPELPSVRTFSVGFVLL
jgi:hypothetical protein